MTEISHDPLAEALEGSRMWTICQDTGTQAESGNCPVHGGDGCLILVLPYRHALAALQAGNREAAKPPTIYETEGPGYVRAGSGDSEERSRSDFEAFGG